MEGILTTEDSIEKYNHLNLREILVRVMLRLGGRQNRMTPRGLRGLCLEDAGVIVTTQLFSSIRLHDPHEQR